MNVKKQLLTAALVFRDRRTGDARTGVYSLADLTQVTQVTINEFGRDAILSSIQQDLAAHNARVAEITAEFATPTTEREEPQPVTGSSRAQRVDEVGRVTTKKDDNPPKVGYPIDTAQFATGWTADYLLVATPAQMALKTIDAERAMLVEHIAGIRRALLNPVNYTHWGYVDDKTNTQVVALYNGDGQVPPRSPNLATFTGSHNHYLANATLTTQAADALVATVAEHTINARLVTVINPADVAAWKALPGFAPLMDARIRVALDQTVGAAGIDTANQTERDVGYYGGSVVRTRGWMPPGYALCYDANANDRVLRMRQPRQAARQGLRIYTDNMAYPLQAQFFVEQFGYGVYNRAAAAVLDFGHASYTAPSDL